MLKANISAKAKDRNPVLGAGVLHGNLHDEAIQQEISNLQLRCIRLFLSSTLTDTEVERNLLMSDVVPFLQEYSLKNRVDFSFYDLNFGSSTEAQQREELDLSRDLLHKCLRQSKGFAVCHIATQLYGSRPAPASIARSIMHKIKTLSSVSTLEDQEILAAHYKLDLNCTSGKSKPWDKQKDMSPGRFDDSFAEYTLSSDLDTDSDKYARLKTILKAAADELAREPGSAADAAKLVCGVVESQVLEACRAIAPDQLKEKLMVVSRTFEDLGAVSADDALKADFVDMADGKVDEEAKELLSNLQAKLPLSCTRIQPEPLPWGPGIAASNWAHAEYLRKLADDVCGEVCGSIEHAVTAAAFKADAVVAEAMLHLSFAAQRAAEFCETETASSALKAVSSYLHSGANACVGTQAHALVVHGRCGSGKTTLLARSVLEHAQKEPAGASDSVIVARFCGLTRQARNVQALLESVVRQLARVYGKPCGDLDDWKALQPAFHAAVCEWPTPDKPLTLFLDALDQLDDFQGGRRLEWLPVKGLPDHVRLIVSTRPDNDLEISVGSTPYAGTAPEGVGAGGSVGLGAGFWCLSLLERRSRADCLVSLDGPVDENEVVPLLLWQMGRRVTAEQFQACSRAVEWRKGLETTGDTMLWLSVIAGVMARWHSEESVSYELGCSVKEVVCDLLSRVEGKHGSGMARAMASCLAYAKAGVSEGEMLHVLSLDDDAMENAYRRTNHIPPVRVMPAQLALAALAELSPLVSERVDASGYQLLTWKHSSIRIFATHWLESKEGIVGSRRRHEQLAEFFSGAWAGKSKRYSPALAKLVQGKYASESAADRMVPRQPLVLHGSLLQRGAGLVLNVRRLEELVHHQILAGKEEVAVQELCSIEYMTAKLTSGMGVDLLSELSHAMQVFSSASDRLHSAMSFLKRNDKMLRNEKMGEAPFQLAMQEPTSSPVKKMFVPESPAVQDRIGGKCRLIEWLNKREEAFPCQMSLSEHDGQVNAVACSPDGTRVASGGRDNLIKICRLATGELETTLRGHTHWINAIAFSSDGELLVSGSVDTTVRIWDLKKGEEWCRELTGHAGSVICVAVSPDGSLVASAGTDKTVRVWDLRPLDSANQARAPHPAQPGARRENEPAHTAAGEVVAQRIMQREQSCWARLCCPFRSSRSTSNANNDSTHELEPESVAPAAAAKHVAESAPLASAARAPVAPELRGVLKGHTSWVNACAFHPDGLTMISGSNDEIKVWYLGTMSERGTMVGHDGPVKAVAFGGNGAVALSGGHDGVIKVWDSRDNYAETGSFAGHLQSVTSLAVSQDGDFVVSGSKDKQVKLWQLSTMQEVGVLDGHSKSVNSVAFSPDGKVILSCSDDGAVKVWERTHKLGKTRKVKAHSHTVSAVAISRDGKTAGTSSFDGSLRVWNAETGEEVSNSLKGHTDRVTCMAISPDGTMLVSGSNDFSVRLWDAVAGRERKCMTGHSHRVTQVVFSADGSLVVSSSIDKTVRMWEVSSGQRMGQALEGHAEGVSTVGISPDGKSIASGSFDNDVRLYEVATGVQRGDPLRGHNNWIKALAFSPDSNTLASAGDDTTIRLWEVGTGVALRVLSGHVTWVTWLSFSADGSALVSGSQDDVRLWDVESGLAKGQPLVGTCCALHAKPNSAAGAGAAASVWFVVTADQHMLRVYQVTPRKKKNDEVKLAACFFTPSAVRNVSACGAAICAGCDTGDVLLLKAAFMAP